MGLLRMLGLEIVASRCGLPDTAPAIAFFVLAFLAIATYVLGAGGISAVLLLAALIVLLIKDHNDWG
jgi:hypothetical protein